VVAEQGLWRDLEDGFTFLLEETRFFVGGVPARAIEDRTLQGVRGARGEVGDDHPDQERNRQSDEHERDDGTIPR
jgi:hypothetical protein